MNEGRFDGGGGRVGEDDGDVGGAELGFEEGRVGEEVAANGGGSSESEEEEDGMGRTHPLKMPKETLRGRGPRDAGIPGAEAEMGLHVVKPVSESQVA
jgi:hypothetical protein